MNKLNEVEDPGLRILVLWFRQMVLRKGQLGRCFIPAPSLLREDCVWLLHVTGPICGGNSAGADAAGERCSVQGLTHGNGEACQPLHADRGTG